MKKLKVIYAVIAAVLLVLAAGTGAYSFYAAPSPTAQQIKGTITVSADKKTVSYKGQTGKTALLVLKSLTSVSTNSSSYGDFVTTIGGVKADGKSEYWAFYVNGKLAAEGAGTYQTKDGDMIEWKLEKL